MFASIKLHNRVKSILEVMKQEMVKTYWRQGLNTSQGFKVCATHEIHVLYLDKTHRHRTTINTLEYFWH